MDIGVVTEAEVCDHVHAHRGDPDLFWSGPFQSLCATHHDRDKQRTETAFQYRPEWLQPSRIPLTIVCGCHASGKSTYVAARAQDDDLVIDLDVIAHELAGGTGSLHQWDRERWLGPAMRRRNDLLGSLGRTPPWRKAWLILSEPVAERRQWWADKMKPDEIVVIEVPAAECFARVRRDESRDRDRTFDAIGRWWQAYSRRDDDVVVKPQ